MAAIVLARVAVALPELYPRTFCTFPRELSSRQAGV